MWAILGCWEQSRAPPSIAVPVTARLVDSGRGAVGTRLRPTPPGSGSYILGQEISRWEMERGPLTAQPSRGQIFQCRWWGPRAATPTAALGDRRQSSMGAEMPDAPPRGGVDSVVSTAGSGRSRCPAETVSSSVLTHPPSPAPKDTTSGSASDEHLRVVGRV